jgi:hypothetical protein
VEVGEVQETPLPLTLRPECQTISEAVGEGRDQFETLSVALEPTWRFDDNLPASRWFRAAPVR